MSDRVYFIDVCASCGEHVTGYDADTRTNAIGRPEHLHITPDGRRTYSACIVKEVVGRSPDLRDLLSAAKQWRQATESRLRLTGQRGEAVPLPADAALFAAIDRAEGKA